jgi:hypothetical protein
MPRISGRAKWRAFCASKMRDSLTCPLHAHVMRRHRDPSKHCLVPNRLARPGVPADVSGRSSQLVTTAISLLAVCTHHGEFQSNCVAMSQGRRSEIPIKYAECGRPSRTMSYPSEGASTKNMYM